MLNSKYTCGFWNLGVRVRVTCCGPFIRVIHRERQFVKRIQGRMAGHNWTNIFWARLQTSIFFLYSTKLQQTDQQRKQSPTSRSFSAGFLAAAGFVADAINHTCCVKTLVTTNYFCATVPEGHFKAFVQLPVFGQTRLIWEWLEAKRRDRNPLLSIASGRTTTSE